MNHDYCTAYSTRPQREKNNNKKVNGTCWKPSSTFKTLVYF